MNAAKSWLIRRHSELHCRQRAAKLPLTASSSVRQSEEHPQLAGVGSERSEILAHLTPFRAPLSTETCKTAPDRLLFSPPERRAPSACSCWLRTHEILAHSTPFRTPLSTDSCKTAPDSLLFGPPERRAPSACRCWLREHEILAHSTPF